MISRGRAAGLGLGFGVVLGFLGWVTIDMGYGTPVIVFLISAPFALNPAVGVLATPLLWSILFVWGLRAETSRQRRRFRIAMAVHYIAVFALIACWFFVGAGKDETLRANPYAYMVPLAICAYILVQFVLWWAFLSRRADTLTAR